MCPSPSLVIAQPRLGMFLLCMTDPSFTSGPNELLLRLNATGLCYSDIHYMLEDLPMPKMSSFNVRSPGHEGAGVVVKIGSDVKTWKVGDRAGVKPMWDTCMNCEWCWDGKHETYCAGAVATGLTVAGESDENYSHESSCFC
jgi:alcohol dehydrogenase, propanol-preferring